MWQHVAAKLKAMYAASHQVDNALALEKESSAICREFYSDPVFDWAQQHDIV